MATLGLANPAELSSPPSTSIGLYQKTLSPFASILCISPKNSRRRLSKFHRLSVCSSFTPMDSAKIKVVGVGGGGNNAVNRMIGSGLHISADDSTGDVNSPFPSLDALLSTDTSTQSDTPKGVKRKAAMMDLIEKQIEVINSGINGVAEALREGNAIAEKGILIAERQVAIVERSHPKVYSEEEVYDALQKIGVPKGLMVDAIIYLLKNPVDLRTFFAVPSDMRLELLYKLMNI